MDESAVDEDLLLVSQIGGFHIQNARAQAATCRLSAAIEECRARKQQDAPARRKAARTPMRGAQGPCTPPRAAGGASLRGSPDRSTPRRGSPGRSTPQRPAGQPADGRFSDWPLEDLALESTRKIHLSRKAVAAWRGWSVAGSSRRGQAAAAVRTILAVSGRQLACAVWTAWWLAVLLGDDVDAAARRDPLVVPGVGYVRALSGGSCAVVAVDAAAARGVVLAAFCRWLAFVAGARALVSGGRMADAVRRCASRACDAEERSSASLAFTVWRALVRANADGRERHIAFARRVATQLGRCCATTTAARCIASWHAVALAGANDRAAASAWAEERRSLVKASACLRSSAVGLARSARADGERRVLPRAVLRAWRLELSETRRRAAEERLDEVVSDRRDAEVCGIVLSKALACERASVALDRAALVWQAWRHFLAERRCERLVSDHERRLTVEQERRDAERSAHLQEALDAVVRSRSVVVSTKVRLQSEALVRCVFQGFVFNTRVEVSDRAFRDREEGIASILATERVLFGAHRDRSIERVYEFALGATSRATATEAFSSWRRACELSDVARRREQNCLRLDRAQAWFWHTAEEQARLGGLFPALLFAIFAWRLEACRGAAENRCRELQGRQLASVRAARRAEVMLLTLEVMQGLCLQERTLRICWASWNRSVLSKHPRRRSPEGLAGSGGGGDDARHDAAQAAPSPATSGREGDFQDLRQQHAWLYKQSLQLQEELQSFDCGLVEADGGANDGAGAIEACAASEHSAPACEEQHEDVEVFEHAPSGDQADVSCAAACALPPVLEQEASDEFGEELQGWALPALPSRAGSARIAGGCREADGLELRWSSQSPSPHSDGEAHPEVVLSSRLRSPALPPYEGQEPGAHASVWTWRAAQCTEVASRPRGVDLAVQHGLVDLVDGAAVDASPPEQAASPPQAASQEGVSPPPGAVRLLWSGAPGERLADSPCMRAPTSTPEPGEGAAAACPWEDASVPLFTCEGDVFDDDAVIACALGAIREAPRVRRWGHSAAQLGGSTAPEAAFHRRAAEAAQGARCVADIEPGPPWPVGEEDFANDDPLPAPRGRPG